jgi:hypothetical protein
MMTLRTTSHTFRRTVFTLHYVNWKWGVKVMNEIDKQVFRQTIPSKPR